MPFTHTIHAWSQQLERMETLDEHMGNAQYARDRAQAYALELNEQRHLDAEDWHPIVRIDTVPATEE